MVFRGTITIECFFADWPLTLMVFQWFYPNSGTMVSNGFGYERTKKTRTCDISHFTTALRNLQNTFHAPFQPFHFGSIVLICTQNLEFMTWRNTLPSWVRIRLKTPFCISPPTRMAEKVPIFLLTENLTYEQAKSFQIVLFAVYRGFRLAFLRLWSRALMA